MIETQVKCDWCLKSDQLQEAFSVRGSSMGHPIKVRDSKNVLFIKASLI